MFKKMLVFLAAILFSSQAFAGYYCEPTYYRVWDSYYGRYVQQRGPDNCYYTYDPPPVVYTTPGYSGGDVALGAILGFGLGVGTGVLMNRGHSHNNNYYYNNHGGYNHGGHGHGRR